MNEILWLLIGIATGSVAGLVPGISVVVLLLAFMPVLLHVELINIFVFYIAFLITTQYFGSMTAIAYGVPGEISSVPAVTHGHRMMSRGLGDLAMSITATGSLIAGLSASILLLLIYHVSQYLVFLFNTTFLVIAYSLVLAIIVSMANKIWAGVLMLTLGLILGKVGFDSLHGKYFFTVPYSLFESGIPFFPLFAGLLIVPMLTKFMHQKTTISAAADWSSSSPKRFLMLTRPKWWPCLLRGSLVGGIMGLVPGASYLMSSTVADRVERRMAGPRAIRQLIAAESANNAAAITVLIPLLVFAIPIVPSEAILLSIAESKGFSSSISLQFIKDHLLGLIGVIILINLINWFLARYWYQLIVGLYWHFRDAIYPMVMIFCITLMCWIAWQDREIIESIIVFSVSYIVGRRIQDDQIKSIGIFGFFLSDSVLDEFYRFITIYF